MVRGFHRGTPDARRLGRPRDDGRFFFSQCASERGAEADALAATGEVREPSRRVTAGGRDSYCFA
jgi:hypothetical protein